MAVDLGSLIDLIFFHDKATIDIDYGLNLVSPAHLVQKPCIRGN